MLLISGPLWAAGPAGGDGFTRLPLYFTENQGQADSRVKFYARGPGQAVYFTPEGMTLSLRRLPAKAGGEEKAPGAVVQLHPLGIRPGAAIQALEPLPGKVNYYRGKSPGQWRTDLPTYRSVLYREAYPGIDLKFYGVGQQVEYDLIVKPGANLKQVKFLYRGAQSLKIAKNGDLLITLPDGGRLVQQKPVVYQEINGRRLDREGKFRLLPGKTGYGFEVASYDTRHPLIVDPVILVYSTYLGGSTWESANAIAVDQSGNAYVIGSTQSLDFPTVAPAQGTYGEGLEDVFITKFNRNGKALVYSTYLGGSGDDVGYAIAVDSAGNAYLTGETSSPDFPLSATPFQGALLGAYNAFVAKLTPAGALSYSTYLGGSTADIGKSIRLDGAGNIYLAGETGSADFFTLLPYQATLNGSTNVFVAKFNAAWDLVYSTFLGGSISDTPWGLAVDGSGGIYVAGETSSDDFPVTNLSLINGTSDAFVTKLDPSGASLAYSTYLGGLDYDAATGGIAVDAAGNAYVAGNTDSLDFPTVNPFQATNNGITNAFITKFDAAGVPVFSSYLGGGMTDLAWFVAVDNAGNAYVTGETNSPDFPTNRAYQQTLAGVVNAFVAKVKTDGSAPLFSTYLGGAGFDQGFGIAVDNGGQAHVAGYTESTAFPTTRNPFQAGPAPTALGAAFVTKLTLPMNSAPIYQLLLLD